MSKSNEDSVIKYINVRKEYHKKYGFMKEMIGLLKNHGIEYDERYLWD